MEDEPEEYIPGVPTQNIAPAKSKSKTRSVRCAIQPNRVAAIAFDNAQPDSIWSRDQVRAMTRKDEDLLQLLDWFTRPDDEPPSAAEVAAASGDVKAYWRQRHLITLEDGVFYKTYIRCEGNGNIKQLIVPRNCDRSYLT